MWEQIDQVGSERDRVLDGQNAVESLGDLNQCEDPWIPATQVSRATLCLEMTPTSNFQLLCLNFGETIHHKSEDKEVKGNTLIFTIFTFYRTAVLCKGVLDFIWLSVSKV